MIKFMKENINPIFNEIWYDKFVKSGNEKDNIVMELGKLFEDVSNLSCLEIGIGTKPFLANKLGGKFNKYTILEKENYSNYNLPSNIYFINSDWEEFESTEKFDIIIASHVVYYFDDKKSAIEKMISYLKPHGKLIIIINGKGFDYGLAKLKFSKLINKQYKFTYDEIKAY